MKNTFIKVYIYHFLINIFIKNKELKLGFGDRVIVLNDFLYEYGDRVMALFSSKFFCKIGIVALSFVFDKYYPIID